MGSKGAGSIEFRATVDRLEGDTAVLLPHEGEGAGAAGSPPTRASLLWPVGWLPSGTTAGTIVTVRCQIDSAATDQARARVQGLLDQLRSTRR